MVIVEKPMIFKAGDVSFSDIMKRQIISDFQPLIWSQVSRVHFMEIWIMMPSLHITNVTQIRRC
jgi:hypothetical protein